MRKPEVFDENKKLLAHLSLSISIKNNKTKQNMQEIVPTIFFNYFNYLITNLT